MAKETCWEFLKDEMLIELVKAKEGLYKMQSPLYSDNKYKQKAWDEIGKIVNYDDPKGRWESLRAQYRKHINKQKTKSGQAATKMTKWKFQDQISFIDEFLNVDRPRITSIELVENSDEQEENASAAEKDVREPSTSKNTNVHDCESQSIRPKKIVDNNNVICPNAKETASTALMKYLIAHKGQETKTSHPIDNFFSLMADTVKNFSPIDQHFVKTKVFLLVNEIESKYLMQSPSYLQTPQVSTPQSSPAVPIPMQSPQSVHSSDRSDSLHVRCTLPACPTPLPQHNVQEYETSASFINNYDASKYPHL